MLPTPKKYFLTSGSAEGNTELTAFDGALLNAGIGNVNIIKVSSILPPKAQFSPQLELPFGALVPTAFGMIISEQPGQIISAGVAVGISEDSFGIIMERTDTCTKKELEKKIEAMVRESFSMRKMELKDLKISSVEHQVQKIGCCIAAVPLWY
jgi:arginine decarboxylase